MKLLYFLFVFSASHFTWSQHIYGSLSGGFLYNTTNEQPPSYIINTYHQISTPWFWRQENYSFKNSLHANISLGHRVTEHVGYEFSGSYLKPTSISENNEMGRRKMTGNFYLTSAKVVLSIPLKKFEIYTKLGVNMVSGKMTYQQTLTDNYSASGITEASLEYEYKSPLSLGFNGAFGFNVPVTKKISFFTEVRFLSQDFSPKSGKMIGYSINGTDLLANNNYDPYYSQIEFGDNAEWYYWNSDDKTQAQKLYKRNYSLGGYGLAIGFKFVLWTKTKNGTAT